MARRRRSRRIRRYASRAGSIVRRVGSARGKFGGFLKRGLVGDTTQALGAGLLASAVTDRVMPQATPLTTLAAEYAAGGVGGMVLAEGVKSFVGMPSVIGGFLSGFGLGQPAATTTGETI